MNDHKTKAEEFLDDARNYGAGSALEASALTAAQVHATLALVEQQRIANLLALSAPQEFGSIGGKVSIPSYDAEGVLRDDIREALSL